MAFPFAVWTIEVQKGVKVEKFEIREDFYLDGRKVKIISGGMHYFRVVPEYWRDRLEKLKALGCNTVETYLSLIHISEPTRH